MGSLTHVYVLCTRDTQLYSLLSSGHITCATLLQQFASKSFSCLDFGPGSAEVVRQAAAGHFIRILFVEVGGKVVDPQECQLNQAAPSFPWNHD